MYYNLFGRYGSSRSRTCNFSPRCYNQPMNTAGQFLSPKANKCPPYAACKHYKDNPLIKSAAFGGFVLPEGTEKGATFNVASLNLDTSSHKDFLVQLVFSCNIITNQIKVRLRFQLFKQEKGQCSSVPISTGILYYRDRKESEANSFTLSACDCDSIASTCCTYSALVETNNIEADGSIIIANPVLIATIAQRN